jgi:hypothetical protein
MAAQRNRRRADRIRAAICITLATWRGHALTIAELVAGIEKLGVDLGASPNKTVGDALRWEVGRGHVRRVGRGRYCVGTLPRSTEYYMRKRVAAYAADPNAPFVRRNYHPVSPPTPIN